MRGENRGASRVRFDHTHRVNLMAVDGTWRRSCLLLDASASGAKLEIDGPADVLQSKEFFLVLSSTGLAFRRCERVWVDGSQIGVRYIENDKGKKPRFANSHD
jgi:PilZ domain-containing protein